MSALRESFRAFVCDLDGVVYRGGQAVPHAVEALTQARSAGIRIAYATNNAARPPQEVAEHLASLGLSLDVADVVTSSQAGAATVRRELGDGASVLAVGGRGVTEALVQAGLRVIDTDSHAEGAHVDAVLQGLGHDVRWRDCAEAAHAINGGALWVATNGDLTLPTDRGIAPGNGALVGVVRHAVSVDPIIVGKPETPLYEYSRDILGTERGQTLAIGDRLDTDIVGANRDGMAAVYVATGVSSVTDVALATGDERPRYLLSDLRGLAAAYDEVTVTQLSEQRQWTARCGNAAVTVDADCVRYDGDAPREHRMRALVAAGWAAADASIPVTADDLAEAAAWVAAAPCGSDR